MLKCSIILPSVLIIAASGLISNIYGQTLSEEFRDNDIDFNSFRYPQDWNIVKEDHKPINDFFQFTNIVEINKDILPKIIVRSKAISRHAN